MPYSEEIRHGTLPGKIKHLVMFSGGACSWAAAKRVVERHGSDGVVLLFADTKMEDEDLYRFLDEAAINVGAPLVVIADGRNPWEVFRDEKMMGNSRVDLCSRILKRELLFKWQKEHCSPNDCVIHFGVDFTESHRLDGVRNRYPDWKCEGYMTEPPYLNKRMILEWIKDEGIEIPRLYKIGAHHNNCGMFCIKSGQAQFALLFRTMPERYKWHEDQEEITRKIVGDHTILKRKVDGVTKKITLKQFREDIERQVAFDLDEWGGCGCALD